MGNSNNNLCVKGVSLKPQSRSLIAAFVEMQVGDTILRVAVRRFRDGSIQAFLPTWENGDCCLDAVDLPDDMRDDFERIVLMAYEDAEDKETPPGQ